jgi:hypothetical protein
VNQIDKRYNFYKQVAGALTFDFFGSRVRPAKPSYSWLLAAVRERIGDRMKKKKCGMLLHKYQVMRQIEKVYQQMKIGAETRPLMHNPRLAKLTSKLDDDDYNCPWEQSLSDLYYRKCGLLMHMIETSIGEQTLDKIIREMYSDACESGVLAEEQFKKKYKNVTGMHPSDHYYNWVYNSSCPELELSYEFNKRNYSLDLTLK